MKGSLAAILRILTLPFGVTSGKRISIDGVDGQIQTYNANNTLVALLSGDGLSFYDSSGKLVASLDATGAKIYNAGVLASALTGSGIDVYDASGNVIGLLDPTGVNVNDPATGSYVKLLHANGASVHLSPGTAATLYGIIDAVLSTKFTTTVDALGHPDYASQMTIAAPYSNASGKTGGRIDLYGDGVWSTTTYDILFTSRAARFTGDLNVMGKLTWNGSRATDVKAVYFTKAGTVVTTPTSGAETALAAWDANSSGAFSFVSGRVYRLSLQFGAYNASSTVDTEFTARIRSAVNSATATQLGFFRPVEPSTIGSNVPSYHYESYVKPNANKSVTLGVTIQRSAGNSTDQVSLYGDANIPVVLVVEDIGSTTEVPALANVATAF